jgi:hypothetical protein
LSEKKEKTKKGRMGERTNGRMGERKTAASNKQQATSGQAGKQVTKNKDERDKQASPFCLNCDLYDLNDYHDC